MRQLLASVLLCLFTTSGALATEFVSDVASYTEGTFATVGGAHYTNTSAAVGQPSPIVGASTAFAGAMTPFNAHYEQDQLVAIGRGGQITLAFPQPVAVTNSPQIAIFTKIALFDDFYPSGATGNPARSDAMDEFGAERTAVVEVGASLADMHSLGRVIFDDPTNAYEDANDPYSYLPSASSQPADFGKPFSGQPSDFSSKSFNQVLATLNGSAGGTWLTVPSNLGVSQIQYVRLGDTMWRLPDGTLVDSRPSQYFPPPNQFIKPADLFIDGAVLIPEPMGIASLWIASLLTCRNRR
jgi:hypothetical protein